jgi:hypothetical protein
MDPDESNHQMQIEMGGIISRIKKILDGIVPKDWIQGELLVRAADASDDRLCLIENTLYNPDSTEQIHDLPKDLIDAIDDLYMVCLLYKCPWASCLITLTRHRSGRTMLGIKFFNVHDGAC